MILIIKLLISTEMYSSKRDALIYGDNIPLYRILYIKRTLKKLDEMIKKGIKEQNRKKTLNEIYENRDDHDDVNVNKRKVSFDLD
jgi:hypothetical protein